MVKLGCPVDGCNWATEKDTMEKCENSVVAHISRKTDENHKGKGYQAARSLLAGDNGTDTMEQNPEPVHSDETPETNTSPSQPAEQTPTDGGSNPARDMPPAEDGATGTTDDAALAEAEQGCPDCNGEMIDTRKTESMQAASGRDVPTPDDFYCSKCGRGFNYS